MNCDDMLMLAVEWKMMKKKAEQIERKKDTINRRNAIVEHFSSRSPLSTRCLLALQSRSRAYVSYWRTAIYYT